MTLVSSVESKPPLLGARGQRVLSLLLAAFCLFAGVRLLGWWPGGSSVLSPPVPTSGTSVGVLGGPEAEVLDFVAAHAPQLELHVVRYSDPARLRSDIESGRIHAGSFENAVALQSALPTGDLVNAGTTVTLPLGFYSRRLRANEAPRDGLTVALPSSPQPLARALLVLFHHGWIVLPEEREANVGLKDVLKNPLHLDLRPLPSDELPSALERFDLVALDYASASRVGLAPARHARLMEDGFSHFPQVLTVRRADKDAGTPWLTDLLSAYRKREVKEFILKHFEDSVRRPW